MSDFREFQPRHCFLVTPSDADQPFPCHGLRVSNETAGWLTLTVRNLNGNPNDNAPSVDVALRIAPGTVDYVSGQFSRVWATGTGALTIHGYSDRIAK